MNTFKKILVATPDGLIQPSVISQSAKLANKQQSHVTFFSVTKELTQEQFSWTSTLKPVELMANLFEEQRISLSNNVEKFQDNFSSVDTCNAVGLPFIEVTKKVQQDNYDLVILAAKESNQPRKRFFGSTTVHLMRKCPCPVLAIGPQEAKPIKRIIAAIDAYAPTEEGHKLNEDILRMASNIAALENAELHVVHAWNLPDDNYLRSRATISEIENIEIVMKKQIDRQKHMDKIIERNVTSALSPIAKLLEGSAQEKIPQYIEENNIDLIVMGTVCRIGIPGYFIGNTAESILSEVSCSVLTLKPEGFASPVE